MKAQDLIQLAYTAYRGKAASKTPTWGSDKANIALEIANRKQREWANDTKQSWKSLFDIKNVGVVSTLTFTYNLDDTFIKPAKSFQIVTTTGNIIEVSLTKPQNSEQGKIYISGMNPKKATFGGTYIDSYLDGGTLKAHGYYIPSDMVNNTDLVSVDNPDWLVYATAAELARNDAAKDDQLANLMGMANDLYTKMIDANNDLGFGQANTVPYDMPQIGDYSQDVAFL
ncbi:MAG: hypothetical protein Q8910_16160 [Bacteroidota bacterium]|nr:hypothetical protein [Bacteroidota bacterium]